MERLIHEEANRELYAALDYYPAISPEPGARLYREMERLMMEVYERLLLFRQLDPPARRRFTDKFPYGVTYLVTACAGVNCCNHAPEPDAGLLARAGSLTREPDQPVKHESADCRQTDSERISEAGGQRSEMRLKLINPDTRSSAPVKFRF